MIYTLLDVAISPIDILMDSAGLIAGITIGVALVVGLTVYFIKKNKNNKKDEEN